VLLFLGVLSVVTALRAQESAPASAAKPATPASATETASTATASDAAEAGEPAAQSVGKAPDGATNPPAPAGPPPARFEPTEKVRADFDVSFPIDI